MNLPRILLDENLSPTIAIVVVQEAEWPAAATTRSFIGLCADLGPPPSAEEIDEARRDVGWLPPRRHLMIVAVVVYENLPD